MTAVVLAAVLAGCLWLALRPPRWLLPDRHARRFGIAMAITLVAGFVLVVRLRQAGITFDAGVISYLLYGPIMVILTGSAVAAAVGRSFRAGLSACAWATALATPLIIAAWLAKALRWYQRVAACSWMGPGASGWAPTWATRSGGP